MTYEPIECGLHDRLEAAATLRRSVRLGWNDGERAEERTCTIVDFRVTDGAEFLVLDGGEQVRLDWIEVFEEA